MSAGVTVQPGDAHRSPTHPHGTREVLDVLSGAVVVRGGETPAGSTATATTPTNRPG
uniref:hypothetical protein n=1 Tax=Micromonospora acroterricola TaxID=2202421 RepID=UPI00191BCDCC|nr:hypothetical protein [Micromonospora acroterricola]